MHVRGLLIAGLLVAAAPARAEPSAVERAREHYARGKAAYAQARYAEALAHFEEAYALSEAPALLFNMAQAQRLSGPDHCKQALDLYRAYQAALPDADNRHEVSERIEQMESCAAEQAARRPPAPATAATSRQPPAQARGAQAPARTAPILVTGIGAAVTVAGAVLYAEARQKFDEARQECPCYPGTYSSWETATYVSYGLLAAGGLTLTAGVSWWVSLVPSSADEPASGLLGMRGQF